MDTEAWFGKDKSKRGMKRYASRGNGGQMVPKEEGASK